MPPDATSQPTPVALAALAQAVRQLNDAPAADRAWRLRRLIADAASLAALEGVEPLTLAQDAWQAALTSAPVTRLTAADGAATVAPAGCPPGATVLPFPRAARG
jgi:hypothetical protein